MANDRCGGCGAQLEPTFRFCAQCGRPASAAAPTAARPAPAAAALRLVPVRHDGRAGPAQALQASGVVCGRTEGQLVFGDDATVSPRHARFTPRADGALLEDLNSLNGTFLRLRAPRPLSAGDELRLGRQLLRLEAVARPVDGAARPWGSAVLGLRFRVVQVLDGGGTGEAFPLAPGENSIGREVGEITFPNDRYVSARHARLDLLESGVVVVDLGSSNGTFVRITGPVMVTAGDQALVGLQLVRVE